MGLTQFTIWGGNGFNQRVGRIIFQNVDPGYGKGVTAQRFIDPVVRPEIVPFFIVVMETIFCNTITPVHTMTGLHRSSYVSTTPSPCRGSCSGQRN